MSTPISVGLALVVCALLGGVATVQWQQRESLLAETGQTAQNLAAAIEAQVRGNVDAVDIALAGLARTLPLLPTAQQPGDADIHAMLRANLGGLPFVRALWVTNAAGDMVHDTDRLPDKFNFATRAYFMAQRDNPSLGLFLGPPIANAKGVWFVSASRRINYADGSFAGIVVAALDPLKFEAFFATVKLGETGAVALLSHDSLLIARAPAAPALVGKAVLGAEQRRMVAENANPGTVRVVTPVDGLTRIVAYRRLPDLPLVVVVGLGQAEALAPWRASSLAFGAAALALSALIAALGYLVWRELSRSRALNLGLQEARLQAEDALKAQNASNAQLRLLEKAVANLNDIVLITEAEPFSEPGPRIVFVNEAFVRRTGYSRDEVIGKTPRILQGPKTQAAELARIGAAMRKWEPVRAELLNYTKSGSEYWLELDIVPVADDSGWFTHWVAVERDITERKASELALLATNQELARSNAELAQFADIASHDLQEPLRALSSCVQLLQKRYGGQLDARADEFIAHAVGGSLRMQTLIDDLLLLSRVNAAPRVHSVIDSAAALEVACANLAGAIAQSSAQISHGALPQVQADPGQLAQLLQNLIGNALKFRGQRAAVVHLGARREGADWVFRLADQGIGIEPQYFGRIFEVFKRLHTRDEYPGTGIGLAICKKIVERHGGRIWVESQPGQGATFYFTLPAGEWPIAPTSTSSTGTGA